MSDKNANPNSANLRRQVLLTEAIARAGAWLDEVVPESDIITRRLILVVTGNTSKLANEYAELTVLNVRTAQRYLNAALANGRKEKEVTK